LPFTAKGKPFTAKRDLSRKKTVKVSVNHSLYQQLQELEKHYEFTKDLGRRGAIEPRWKNIVWVVYNHLRAES